MFLRYYSTYVSLLGYFNTIITAITHTIYSFSLCKYFLNYLSPFPNKLILLKVLMNFSKDFKAPYLILMF